MFYITDDMYDATQTLEERKAQLEDLTITLEDYYCLSRNDLARYIVPSNRIRVKPIVAESIQVDLLIHLLNLWSIKLDENAIREEVISIVQNDIKMQSLLSINKKKLKGSLMGRIIAKNKQLDPRELSNVISETVDGL